MHAHVHIFLCTCAYIYIYIYLCMHVHVCTGRWGKDRWMLKILLSPPPISAQTGRGRQLHVIQFNSMRLFWHKKLYKLCQKTLRPARIHQCQAQPLQNWAVHCIKGINHLCPFVVILRLLSGGRFLRHMMPSLLWLSFSLRPLLSDFERPASCAGLTFPTVSRRVPLGTCARHLREMGACL